VAEKIRYLRKKAGLTQTALARLAQEAREVRWLREGKTEEIPRWYQPHISRIEEGDREISTAQLDDLADALGVTTAELHIPVEAREPVSV